MAEDLEAQIRTLADSDDLEAAANLAIREYGPELLGFLVTRTRDHDVAGDAFGEACEDLWKSLDTFGWRCSMRTWMYKLARNAVSRRARSPQNRPSRRGSISRVAETAQKVRTRTGAYLRTEVKDQFALLRDELEPEGRMLLVLRVDRQMSWNDVAEVLADTDLSEDELRAASARHRQHFKKVKETLRERAEQMGLLDTAD